MKGGSVLVCLVSVSACVGTLTENDGGLLADGGLSLSLKAFAPRTDGWPANAPLLGASLLDGVITAATSAGVFELALDGTSWQSVNVPLTEGESPTSLQRIDTTVVLTVASANGGGVFARAVSAANWHRITSAPNLPSWQLSRRGSLVLLATSAGLYTASSLEGPYTLRSAATAEPFIGSIAVLAATPQQLRLFATKTSNHALYVSDDNGATWATGLLSGAVTALTSSGPFVYLQNGASALRSDNYGNTFKPLANPLGAPANVFLVNQGRVWAGTSRGLSFSDDDGATFQDDAHGLPVGLGVTQLVISGSLIIADTVNGPYVTQFQ